MYSDNAQMTSPKSGRDRYGSILRLHNISKLVSLKNKFAIYVFDTNLN